jgi:hypothetical protein
MSLVKLAVGKVSQLVLDESGQFWQEFLAPTPSCKTAAGPGTCENLCGHKLKRPHFSCQFCRARKAWSGDMPSRIRVTPYILLLWKDRPGRAWKEKLLKKILPICEYLAN